MTFKQKIKTCKWGIQLTFAECMLNVGNGLLNLSERIAGIGQRIEDKAQSITMDVQEEIMDDTINEIQKIIFEGLGA